MGDTSTTPPTGDARRTLRFESCEHVIADVRHLRAAGYRRLGEWSLERMCFHLGRPIPVPLKAVAADPPPAVQPAVVQRFRYYVETGRPPAGAVAPPGSEPPSDCGPGVIDDLFDRLRAVQAFDGPYVDMGARGPVPVDLYKPFILAHCGHHLSYLIPTA